MYNNAHIWVSLPNTHWEETYTWSSHWDLDNMTHIWVINNATAYLY